MTYVTISCPTSVQLIIWYALKLNNYSLNLYVLYIVRSAFRVKNIFELISNDVNCQIHACELPMFATLICIYLVS